MRWWFYTSYITELPRIRNSLLFSLDADPCSEEGRGVMAEKQVLLGPEKCRLILLSCGLIFMVRERYKCCTCIKTHLKAKYIQQHK